MKKNKKAISEIVSYTLLIIIAVGLSVLVYAYLKVYIPKDRASCPEDISLIIQDVKCTISNLNITLKNKGLFNITDAYIRIGSEGRKVKLQINQGRTSLGNLAPGQSKTLIYSIPNNIVPSRGEYILEIQPATMTEKSLALCNNAVITEKINCF